TRCGWFSTICRTTSGKRPLAVRSNLPKHKKSFRKSRRKFAWESSKRCRRFNAEAVPTGRFARRTNSLSQKTGARADFLPQDLGVPPPAAPPAKEGSDPWVGVDGNR